MNTFPLEFSKHIIFCIIGVAFFLFQYYRQGFKYQLLTAAAIGSTLLLYINDSNIWRYTIGIFEAVLIILIFIIMSIEKKKATAKEENNDNDNKNNGDSNQSQKEIGTHE